MLAGIPYRKNSPVENCFESYAMALGAAPTSNRKRHAGGNKRRKENHLRRHMKVRRNHQGNGERYGDGGHVHDEVGHHHHKKGDAHDKNKPGGFFEHGEPVDGKPLGGPGVPQAEADAHGAAEKKDNIPGDIFQVVHIQNPG